MFNNTSTVRKNIIPFSVTYSPSLPNIKEIIDKQWYILNNSYTFRDLLKTSSVIAFHKNSSFRQIIGTDTIRVNQKISKVKQNPTKGEYTLCNTLRCLSCKQIIQNTTFRST